MGLQRGERAPQERVYTLREGSRAYLRVGLNNQLCGVPGSNADGTGRFQQNEALLLDVRFSGPISLVEKMAALDLPKLRRNPVTRTPTLQKNQRDQNRMNRNHLRSVRNDDDCHLNGSAGLRPHDARRSLPLNPELLLGMTRKELCRENSFRSLKK